MNLLILICLALASAVGIKAPVQPSVKPSLIVEKSETSPELVGFGSRTVDEIKRLVGAFYIDVERSSIGNGGFTFPGVHDKAQVLGEMLCNDRRAYESFKSRIECRRTGDLVVQMALSFESSEQCDRFLEYFKANFSDFDSFDIREGGGGGIIEIGTKGVNKATLMNYLSKSHHLQSLLTRMGYQGGKLIDARKTLSIIVSDANGTIFPQPSAKIPYQECNLKSSQALSSIIEYLEGGGFLVINSGNDPKRLGKKVIKGIPSEKKHLLKNIAIGAGNGHLLFVFNQAGDGVEEVVGYRKSVPQYLKAPQNREVQFLYLGDNPKATGNDWDGYLAAGFLCSICVAHPKNVHLVPPELKGRNFAGNDAATHLVFKAVVETAKEKSAANQKFSFSPETVNQIMGKMNATSKETT